MKNIKQIANRLARKYGTREPLRLISELGFIVRFAQLGSTLGFHYVFNRIHVIIINEDADEHLQRFIAAHELGHAVLHQGVNTAAMLARSPFAKVSTIEREANLFAVELLLPDELLREYPDIPLPHLAATVGIPEPFCGMKEE